MSSRRDLILAVVGIGAVLVLLAAAVSTLSNGPGKAPPTSGVAATTAATTAPTTVPSTSDTPTSTETTPVETTATSATTPPPIELTVGHNVGRPPFQSHDSTGVLIGFEVDLIDELMKNLVSEPTWVETDFTELTDGTAAGRYDIAVAGLLVSDYLLERMLFTAPYFNEQYGLIVNPSNDPTITSFAGLTAADRIGVTNGTRADLWTETNLAPLGVQIIRFENGDAANDALDSGNVDGVVSAVMYRYISSGRLAQYRFVDVAPSGEVVAFGVDPAQPELHAHLDAALAAIVADGTYQAIYDRWFDDASASVAP